MIMHGNFTIAVCDILGFTHLVNNTPLKIVVNDALGWFQQALHHSIHKNNFPKDVPSLKELQNQSNVGVAWFSDTVLLYTKKDTNECLQALLSTLAWLLFETIIEGTTRIRCGISYGEVYIDSENSIYVGPPIVDAYLLEEKQNWSGGAFTDDGVKRLPEIAKSGKYVYEWYITPYKVPLKKDQDFNTLAIDWTLSFHTPDPNFLQWSKESKEPKPDDWEKSPDICKKWKNTKEFHDRVCNFCKKDG